MHMMMQHSIADDWVLATGETHTVQEFVELAFKEVDLNWKDYVTTDKRYYRPNEVEHLLGDPSKAKKELGWKNKTSFENLVKKMVESDLNSAEREKVLIEKGLLRPTWEYSIKD